MSRDSRYDVLFEPVRIGPVTAKNRFYQVPHCAGMGHRYPHAAAAMRGIKAEGGWAVVSTEEAEIHYSSEISPANEARIWDEKDIPALRLMTDAVHEHGALAAIELVYNGFHAPNRFSREVPMAPSHTVVDSYEPVQARAMDKKDIADFRRWHRAAAMRAREAGFDIIYAYAGHDMSLPMHFLSRRHNHRSDEYGGSLQNRIRLLREMIEDMKDAIGDRCAVAVRMAVDELLGEDGITGNAEGQEIVAELAELPDLWDVNISDWSNDSMTARFSDEGFQEPYTAFVKSVTTKPVVGVGRFTSPDTMIGQIRRGVLDMIGAARPSIADPFLPQKINRGRQDEIRECIGCNICVASDNIVAPIRCTQNPTMGEEWRRDWHPEQIPRIEKNTRVLVVGAGPAGMECAQALGARGCSVVLAEGTDHVGGRVARESKMPGLASWARVRDYRLHRIEAMPNVELFLESHLETEHVLELGCEYVVIATGSHWRRDGIGRQRKSPVPGVGRSSVLTPDDVLEEDFDFDAFDKDRIVIFDDDHYYMGGVIAEAAIRAGCRVELVTPAAAVSVWTEHTLEQTRIQAQLLRLGVTIRPHKKPVRISNGVLELACVYTDKVEEVPFTQLISVTERMPERMLYDQVEARAADWPHAGIKSVQLIGDAFAPGTIAAAVYGGHRYARELGCRYDPDVPPFKRELPRYLGDTPPVR